MTKQSFLKGAAIFAIAGIFAKFLGIFFKVPLNYLTGDEGLGIYNYPYPLYVTMLAIASGGLPVAISKMVSERIALNRRDEAHRVFKIALTLLAILGTGASVVLFASGRSIVEYSGWDSRTLYSLYALAASPLFVAIMSAFRGYFQGMHNMVPTSISLIVESFGRAAIGIGLAYVLLDRGIGIAVGGASFGATAGAICGALVLIFIYMSKRDRLTAGPGISKGPREKASSIIYNLLAISVPISVGAAVSSFMGLIDSIMVPSRMAQIGAYTSEQITEIWGLYGKGLTMVNVPLTFSVAIAASMVPAISSAVASKNYKDLREKTISGIRISIILALPSAIGLSMLADAIIPMIFRMNTEGGYILEVLAYTVIFIILTQTLTSILQGMGRVIIPVINLFIGGIVKMVANYILVAIPYLNINGASIGSIAGYVVATILNYWAVKKYTGVKVGMVRTLVKPIIASILMAISVRLSYDAMFNVLGSNTVATLGSIAIGGVVYLVALVITGTMDEQDLDMIPGGNKIKRFIPKYRKQ